MNAKIVISLVILEGAQGRIALQLRGDIPDIANPGKWGLFGGHAEPGEEAFDAAVREVQEELTCALEPGKMGYLQSLDRNPDKQHFVFHYLVNNELDAARLNEGQRFGFFSRAEIEKGSIEGHKIVPHHLKALRDYWAGNDLH